MGQYKINIWQGGVICNYVNVTLYTHAASVIYQWGTFTNESLQDNGACTTDKDLIYDPKGARDKSCNPDKCATDCTEYVAKTPHFLLL